MLGSEGTLRQWSLLARCRFRPSVPWCFVVSEPPAGRSLWSCFEGMGAALWSWFLVGSEGNVRQWTLLARAASFRRTTGRQANRGTGMPWCFAVSEPPAETSLWSCFEGMGAALWSWFLVGSEGNVRQWSLLARCRFRPSVPWCFAVSEPPAGRSDCGAALRAWASCTLDFGALVCLSAGRRHGTGRQADRQADRQTGLTGKQGDRHAMVCCCFGTAR